MSHSRKSSSKDNYPDFLEKSNHDLKTSSNNNYQTSNHNPQQILKLEQELQDAKKSIQLLKQELIASNQNLERCNIKYHRKIQKLTQLNIESENALLEQETRTCEINRFFHLSLDLLCIASPDGYFKQINYSFTKTLGYSPQELLTRPYIDFVHPEDVAATLQKIEELGAGSDIVGFENRCRSQDGSYIWLRWTATNCHGQIYATAHDLTGQKLAQELKDRLLTAIETTSDGITILHDHKFIYLNQAHLKIYGYSKPEELIGQSWHLLYTEESIATFETEAFPILLEQGQWQGVIQAKHRNDKTFITEITLSLTTKGDLICICRDISDRVKMENSLRASTQLEAANRAKDIFIAQMNHELRTPLTSILGFSHLLQQDHKLDPKQQSYVDIISHSGQHLLNLINDILDYSKITAEKLELEPRDFNLIDFLNEIVTVFMIRTQPKGLDFKTMISPDLPIIVHADETKLRQVLDNLLNNAIKFTDTGSITLKVHYPQNHNSPTSDTPHSSSLKKIRFQIEDTGMGIPTEQIAEVFTPFKQLNDSAKQYEGTGLGLTISQNIIQLMGSEIQLESQVNQGSKFWFDLDMLGLDAYIKPKPHHMQSQAARHLRKPQKILVVDNSDDNRNLLVNHLQYWGFMAKEANDCEVGLAMATKFRPDAIIIDVAMPTMDGMTLIPKLKEHSQLRDTVIIMISADSQLIPDSAKIDCHGFLSKPVDLEQLQELLASYLPFDWQVCESSKKQNNLSAPVTPSQQELIDLLELADLGDLEAIEEQINSLEFLDEQLSSFGQEVRKLAVSFKQHQLENFLKSFIFD